MPSCRFAGWIGFALASLAAPATACVSVTAVAAQAPLRALHFQLRNDCAAPITLLPRELPWGDWNSIDLTAVVIRDPAEVLPRLAPLYHDQHEAFVLRPGESREDDVGLSAWFGDVDAALRRGDVRVLWVYRLPELLGGEYRRGEVVFSRAR